MSFLNPNNERVYVVYTPETLSLSCWQWMVLLHPCVPNHLVVSWLVQFCHVNPAYEKLDRVSSCFVCSFSKQYDRVAPFPAVP